MTPPTEYPFTRIATARRDFLAANLPSWDRLSVLEIGAFDNPTFVRPASDVYYLDSVSKHKLQARNQNKPRRLLELAVELDYLVKSGPLSKAVRRTFDLIVAHHVLEHIPDPIGWLIDLARITNPGGHAFLTLPDRRYTFDLEREPTDAVELLRCHDEQLVRPSYYQVLRDRYYHRSVKLKDILAGKAAPGARPRPLSLCEAMDQANAARQGDCDCHCHVFTSESFRTVWHDLATAGLVPWIDLVLGDTPRGENEFPVLLRRTDVELD